MDYLTQSSSQTSELGTVCIPMSDSLQRWLLTLYLHALCYGTFHQKCILSPHSAKLDWPCGWLWWTECRQDTLPVLNLGLRKPHGLCLLTCTSAITRRACTGWLGDGRKTLGVEPSHPDYLCRSQPQPAGPQTLDKPRQNKQSCLGDHQLTPDASTVGHWSLVAECYRALL